MSVSEARQQVLGRFSTMRHLHTDLKLVCEEQEILCHKFVLSAQSEMFRGMFNTKTKENVTNIVEINDTNFTMLNMMIDFMYTGEFPDKLDTDMASDLLYVANKYILPDMVEFCVKSLMKNIKVEDYITTFILIDKFAPQSNGRKKMITMMQWNGSGVVNSSDWKEFIEKHPDLATEFVKKICERIDYG
eukprot:GFUD01018800.1.p1 GENE.GFUD01018800.1~~GFUD01018800.1.p1  ORF type:complete len:189 (+),score=57.17 GFUD01018800.1:95-661(+)